MKLTNHTDYSLRVLMYLNQTQKQVTLNELADTLEISKNNLIKVSNQLSKLGFIKSNKGKYGGLIIGENTGQVTVKTIVESLGENLFIAECFSEKGNCVFLQNCKLKVAFSDALEAFLNSLDGTTLDDISPSAKHLKR